MQSRNPYKFSVAQIPNAIVAIKPPNEKISIGASPPSRVVPTRSPTFFAYLRLGPEHCGQRNPGLCSSKYNPAHSNLSYIYPQSLHTQSPAHIISALACSSTDSFLA